MRKVYKMSNNKLLTVPEVLQRLKISRKTLYALMERGQIKPIDKPSYLKRAAKLQFREEDVQKLLDGDADPRNNAA
jgi:predicted DNA-binding transcriptional regulator AlpA